MKREYTAAAADALSNRPSKLLDEDEETREEESHNKRRDVSLLSPSVSSVIKHVTISAQGLGFDSRARKKINGSPPLRRFFGPV